MLDIVVMNHTEYLPRSQLQALEQEQLKQSPKATKNMGKRAQQKQAASPSFNLPESMVTSNGVPIAVMSFLEVRVSNESRAKHLANQFSATGGRNHFANADVVPIFPAKPAHVSSRGAAQSTQHPTNPKY